MSELRADAGVYPGFLGAPRQARHNAATFPDRALVRFTNRWLSTAVTGASVRAYAGIRGINAR
jgi:hypothetical protein